jgi:hypothetical protein
MNIQEREQLSQFLQQLTQARVDTRDTEAEALIRESCNRQPDAAYLLVQRTLLQEQALKNAQSQISRLQAQLDQIDQLNQGRSASRGSFLGDANNAWGTSPAAAVARPQMQQPMMSAPAPASVAQAGVGWGSGWLGNVATTAAGVVAGSFLFQGIGSLMGNHGNGWMSGGSGSGLQPQDRVTENTVVNNYYDGNGPGGGDDFEMAALDADIVDDTSDVI